MEQNMYLWGITRIKKKQQQQSLCFAMKGIPNPQTAWISPPNMRKLLFQRMLTRGPDKCAN